MENILIDKLNYWVFILLMMLGLWAMISKNNLIKKVMGMSIFQAAVIMFYVSIATKDSSADIPIYPHDVIHPEHHGEAMHGDSNDHLKTDHTEAASELHPSHTSGDSHAHALKESHGSHHDTHTHSHDSHQASDVHTAQSHDSKTGDHGDYHEDDTHSGHGHHSIAGQIDPADYDNPLPHVLMLTAIVVGVATLGVALALIQRVYRLYGSIEESEVIAAIEKETKDELTLNSESNSNPENSGIHA